MYQAHQLMRTVASNIDQVKRNMEQLSRVKELSGILDGWLGPGEWSAAARILKYNKINFLLPRTYRANGTGRSEARRFTNGKQ